MKMQAERIEGQNAIARHAADGVMVNGVEHRSSVVVPWQGEVAVAAAARTYNVLLAEGRRVVAALLFEQAPPAA